MQPTKGEVNLYNQIKGRTVRAVKGKSDVGEGWRPVCAGRYLGNQCSDSEKGAINYGIKLVEQLKQKIEQRQMPFLLPEKVKPKRERKPKENV